MAACSNCAFKIAAKQLQLERDMLTIGSVQELVIALSNGTIGDPLRRTI